MRTPTTHIGKWIGLREVTLLVSLLVGTFFAGLVFASAPLGAVPLPDEGWAADNLGTPYGNIGSVRDGALVQTFKSASDGLPSSAELHAYAYGGSAETTVEIRKVVEEGSGPFGPFARLGEGTIAKGTFTLGGPADYRVTFDPQSTTEPLVAGQKYALILHDPHALYGSGWLMRDNWDRDTYVDGWAGYIDIGSGKQDQVDYMGFSGDFVFAVYVKQAVQDTTPPVLTLPGTITKEATGPEGAEVTFEASATDEVDGSVPVTCTPGSGSLFPLGTTTVNCTAEDAAHNVANGSFDVNVVDTTPPVIKDVPSDITKEATEPGGTHVSWQQPTATDLVDGNNVTITTEPASDSLFPIGETTVKVMAIDSHNNAATDSFKVTVQDTTAPKVTSVMPIENATGVAPGVNVTATFSEDMQRATVKSAFKLFKKGSDTKIAAAFGFNEVTDTATLNPTNNLRRGVTYKAVVTTVAKDTAGNSLDQNPSLDGPQQMKWFFTIKR